MYNNLYRLKPSVITCVTVCSVIPVPPADLYALGPGYGVRPDLVTTPLSLVCAVCGRGARDIGSNLRNDVVGPVT